MKAEGLQTMREKKITSMLSTPFECNNPKTVVVNTRQYQMSLVLPAVCVKPLLDSFKKSQVVSSFDLLKTKQRNVARDCVYV